MLDLMTSLGWDDARDAEFAPFASSAVPARVSRVDRGMVDVLTADNPLRVERRTSDPDLAVGDWVSLVAADRRWQIDTLLTRRSLIRRAPVNGESAAQLLAANVDLVLVVVPAVPEPRPGMTERLVALSWDSGATPVVVLTKCDLVSDAHGIADDLRATAPGVDVVTVSGASADGYAPLRPLLTPGVTSCLLGRSGAGKSTLANALVGGSRFATAEIRADGKGRHTTSFRELVVLPTGGVLVDTPGLRGVGLWLDGDGLERAFADVEELVTACRFSDCAHETEPGCAVLGALADGGLDERRYASWRKLQREAQWMARRTDARLRAEELRRWKAISVDMRRSRRARP